MTRTLQETFHDQADRRDFAAPDLDAIVRQGARRVRRRRTAGVAAIAAGVLAVAALGVTLPRLTRPETTSLPASTPGPKPFTYVVGTELHQGDRTTDLGHRVAVLAQTDRGVVFSDPQRTVWSYDGSGPTRVGTITRLYDTHRRIVADKDGTRVAWLEGDQGVVTLAVLDVRTGGVVRAEIGSPRSAEVRAVDGGTVYVYADHDVVGVDIATRTRTVLAEGVLASGLADVSNGFFLRTRGNDRGMVVGRSMTGSDSSAADFSSGTLSPDGSHWFSDWADQFAVVDSATGKRQDPPHDGFLFAAPYQWLDDDTIAVLAMTRTVDTAPISLLTCHVSTNDCEVTARAVGSYPDVALPLGQDLAG